MANAGPNPGGGFWATLVVVVLAVTHSKLRIKPPVWFPSPPMMSTWTFVPVRGSSGAVPEMVAVVETLTALFEYGMVGESVAERFQETAARDLRILPTPSAQR